jgi:hypothetical protein
LPLQRDVTPSVLTLREWEVKVKLFYRVPKAGALDERRIGELKSRDTAIGVHRLK